jgi:DNA-binding NarL/FixJ family response regulator
MRPAYFHRADTEDRATIWSAELSIVGGAGSNHVGIGWFCRLSFGATTGYSGQRINSTEAIEEEGCRAITAPRVVGIDEWAWRKGHRYGTILCDLEKGKVIDLPADCSVDSTVAWLRAHPGIEIVSRDRSSVYSEAAVRAAPQATQIADRWHLLRNLSEALIGALAPHHWLMTEAAQAVCGKLSPNAVEMRCATSRMSQKEAARQRSRERRMAVYETAMELVRGGLPQPEVARRLSIDSRTIRRWVESNGFPEQSPR